MTESKYKAQEKYQKEKMGTVLVKYRKDFVDEFKEACNTLGVSQSAIVREAMEATIERAKKSTEK